MHRYLIPLLCLMCPICTAADIDNAERIMTQRFEVERETSQLLLDWQTEKQQLESQLTLYQHEYTVLSDKLKQKQLQHDEVQAQREHLLTKQKKAEVQSAQYQALLDDGAVTMTTMWPRLPTSLQQHLSKAYGQLNNTQADLTERMVALTEMTKQIEQFDQTVNLHLGEMTLADKRWQTEQLYLGLAQAFYRLPDGSQVGIGFPTVHGWQWQAVPELKETINRAFAIYRQQQAPALITLPIHVHQEQK